jgi:hypothetical protein
MLTEGAEYASCAYATKGAHFSLSSNISKGAHTTPSNDASPNGHTKYRVNWLSSPRGCSSWDVAGEQQPGDWYSCYGEHEPERSAV